MREALAEALSDFDGAIVLVSHDRHLIGLVSDRFWRVADGVVKPFDGDLDEYAAWLRSRPAGEAKMASTKQAEAAGRAVETAPANTAKGTRPGKTNPHKLARTEAEVAELEAELAGIETRLADPALYGDDGAGATQLAQRQAELRRRLDAAEIELLALYATDAA